jgi:hypothetical protein
LRNALRTSSFSLLDSQVAGQVNFSLQKTFNYMHSPSVKVSIALFFKAILTKELIFFIQNNPAQLNELVIMMGFTQAQTTMLSYERGIKKA